MPDMPAWLSKGPILKKIDDANPDKLRAILARLQNPNDPLASISVELLPVSTPVGQHISQDWFTNRWWPEGANAEPVLREGFKQAIEIALGGPKGDLPLDVLWVCHHKPDSDLRVGISWNDRQVTVILYTPPVPDNIPPAGVGDASLTINEQIKVVRMKNGQVEVSTPKFRGGL